MSNLYENNLNLFSQQDACVMLCSLMKAPESSNEITSFPGAGDQIRVRNVQNVCKQKNCFQGC